MDRAAIKDRVVGALGQRDDTATVANINTWIAEVIREIESSYPLSYTKSAKTATISADVSVYSFDQAGLAEIIFNHPHYMSLLSVTTPTTYSMLTKIHEGQFDEFFVEPTTSGTPKFWLLEGGTNGWQFRLYPTPEVAQTMKLDGYFFTDTSGWTDTSTNWLTDHEPNVIIEGVKSLAFEYYGQDDKSLRSRALYNAFLNGSPQDGVLGLIPAERKKSYYGRHLRVKTFGDLPLIRERKLRTYS